MKTFTRDASFCDAIVMNYDEMVLEIFIDTIAKPRVIRLTAYRPFSILFFNCYKIFYSARIGKHYNSSWEVLHFKALVSVW